MTELYLLLVVTIYCVFVCGAVCMISVLLKGVMKDIETIKQYYSKED